MMNKKIEYFLFELVVDNGFQGTQFVLEGGDIYPLLGFHKRYVLTTLKKKYTQYPIISGFKITPISERKVVRYRYGLPDCIAKMDKRYRLSHIIPIIGTVNIGKFSGTQFAFFGSADIPPFFSQGVISTVINGRVRQHKGCRFQRATHREAIPLHNRLTQEIIDDLMKYEKIVKPIVAIPLRGAYEGIEYPLVSANNIREFFDTASVRGVVTGHKANYLGFTFKHTTYTEIKGNENKLTREVCDETQDALKVPFIVNVVKGPLAGHEFGCIYLSVAEKYFSMRGVQGALRGDRATYLGCAFTATTYKKAKKMTSLFTHEIAQYLEMAGRK